jgi:hypothetical protein
MKSAVHASVLERKTTRPLILKAEGIIAAGDNSVRIFRDEVDLIASSCFTDVVKCAWIKVLQGRRPSRSGLNFIWSRHRIVKEGYPRHALRP